MQELKEYSNELSVKLSSTVNTRETNTV